MTFRTLTVASWNDLVQVVGHARQILKAHDDEEVFFRGQADMRFELLPILQRKALEHGWSDEDGGTRWSELTIDTLWPK